MNPRLPVFLAHAPADQRLARELAAFLESGCDVQCEAVGTSPREDLIELAEQCTGHLVLLLSKDSWPTQIPRERWEPVLKDRPLACVLVNSCPLPGLLRRGPFFELERGNAGRGLKRWLWGRGEFRWSPDLEELYAALADRSGVRTCDPETVRRFAREAEGDFEAVLWVPCHDRSLAEALGELGDQLGLLLDGPPAANRERVLDNLASRRCLLVLDAPPPMLREELTAAGRCSTLVTTAPSAPVRELPHTFDYARQLMRGNRLAEAYELLYSLMDEAVVDPKFCASELAWICDHWGRTREAEDLRAREEGPGVQMGLFD